mmetsp:Transcript_10659/g.39136  ORF Transcript_10659/g.39136 Transcript_10659/m.39136 type:complete len:230 (+) Transcript_10659:821-1510(+)
MGDTRRRRGGPGRDAQPAVEPGAHASGRAQGQAASREQRSGGPEDGEGAATPGRPGPPRCAHQQDAVPGLQAVGEGWRAAAHGAERVALGGGEHQQLAVAEERHAARQRSVHRPVRSVPARSDAARAAPVADAAAAPAPLRSRRAALQGVVALSRRGGAAVQCGGRHAYAHHLAHGAAGCGDQSARAARRDVKGDHHRESEPVVLAGDGAGRCRDGEGRRSGRWSRRRG